MLRQIVCHRLNHHGWVEQGYPAVAGKSFPTAAGRKEASAYLTTWPEASILEGCYSSEGRNILESCAVVLRPGISDAAIIEFVDQFVCDAEAKVADSYAARLLHLVAAPAA